MPGPNENLGTSCTHRQSNHRAMRRDHRTTNDHEHPGSPPLGPRGGRGSCRESARQRADRACQADGSGSESTPTSPLDCERFCRAEAFRTPPFYVTNHKLQSCGIL